LIDTTLVETVVNLFDVFALFVRFTRYPDTPARWSHSALILETEQKVATDPCCSHFALLLRLLLVIITLFPKVVVVDEVKARIEAELLASVSESGGGNKRARCL
jgi:hypothetical protein